MNAKKELRKEILARIKREVDTTECQTGKFGVREPKAHDVKPDCIVTETHKYDILCKH